VKIGKNVRLGFNVVLEEGCEIGDNCIIGHNVVFRHHTIVGHDSVVSHQCVSEGDCWIGHHTTIEPQCHLTMGMKIGNYCFFGPGVITTNTRDIAHHRAYSTKINPPIIGNGVRIGGGVILAPGTFLGDNTLVKCGTRKGGSLPGCMAVRESISYVYALQSEDERLVTNESKDIVANSDECELCIPESETHG